MPDLLIPQARGRAPFRAAPDLNPGAVLLGGAQATATNNMTGDESRKLKVGDRVRWKGDATNQGTVRGTSWSGVTIDWDDGDSTSVSHNDTAQVDRTKL